jgi:hypothetical protein
MEENQEKRASLRNDASIQERRERILAKPCRTINLSNAREEKEGNWNVRFQAIRKRCVPPPPPSLSVSLSLARF